MAAKTKPTVKRTVVPWKREVKLQLWSFTLFLLAFILSSLVVHVGGVSKQNVRLVSLTALSAASLLCGMIAGRQKQKNGLLSGLLAGLPVICVILLLSLIASSFSPDWSMLLSGVILLLCAMLGGVVGVNRKQNAKTKRLLKGRRP